MRGLLLLLLLLSIMISISEPMKNHSHITIVLHMQNWLGVMEMDLPILSISYEEVYYLNIWYTCWF